MILTIDIGGVRTSLNTRTLKETLTRPLKLPNIEDASSCQIPDYRPPKRGMTGGPCTIHGQIGDCVEKKEECELVGRTCERRVNRG
jgi:hypothetical protein